MPTITEMELPRPKNWQEFESMARDAMAQRWGSSGLQANGRPGQKQDGVDIFGVDDIGRNVGIQCKRSADVPSIKLIEEEIANAEAFKPKLSALFVATTADYDSTLQSAVRALSDKRVAKGKFAVAMIFWRDIIKGLALNSALLKLHYPNLTIDAQQAVDPERILAALELGYYGGDLWELVLLVHGEFGWMAQVDPDNLTAILRMLENRAAQLLPPADAQALADELRGVREGCLAPKRKKSDWDIVEQRAKRVQTRISAARSLLSGDEGKLLSLSIQLGAIYAHSDNLPDEQTRNDIAAKVVKLLPGRDAIVSQRFASATNVSSGYEWAPRIFSFLLNELRWA